MNLVLGIDPGNTYTAFALVETFEETEPRIIDCRRIHNLAVLSHLSKCGSAQPVCEMIASYGMAVGKTVFETCVQIGRLETIAPDAGLKPMKYVTRIQVKSTICHSAKANDSNIRQALIDRYGPQGTKKNPGPTYGISKDMWAALAVATAYIDGAKLYEFEA